MTQERRLDKIENSLTPIQAVILWLQEIQQYRNVVEYVQYLRGQPESAAPITRITRQIDLTVRESMKGRPREVVENAVHQAVRDVCFLIKLHHKVNFKVLENQKAWTLMVALLAEMQNRMLTEATFHKVLRDKKIRINREMRIWTRKRDQNAIDFQVWQGATARFLVELYSFRDTAAFINRHYFDGHIILFPDSEPCVADLIEETEKLVGMFNDLCMEEQARRYRIDLEVIQKGISDSSKAQTTYLVDMAKAEALDAMGEDRAATELVARYL